MIALHLTQRSLAGEVVPVHVRDGHLQHLPRLAGGGKGRVGSLHPQVDEAAEELQPAVAQHGTGQQPSLKQDLKTIADAQHQPAALGELFDRTQDRRVAGEGAGAEVVAIGEAAGQHDGVEVVDLGGLVPDPFGGLAEHAGEDVEGVVVAIGTGKNDHAEFHGRYHSAV